MARPHIVNGPSRERAVVSSTQGKWDMYLKACDRADLVEGGIEPAALDRRLVLLVWPKGGKPRAFQGFCPHKREALVDARFDGATLVCPYHDWVFDGRSGKCLDGKTCRLAEYPLRIEGDDVLVDTADVADCYL